MNLNRLNQFEWRFFFLKFITCIIKSSREFFRKIDFSFDDSTSSHTHPDTNNSRLILDTFLDNVQYNSAITSLLSYRLSILNFGSICSTLIKMSVFYMRTMSSCTRLQKQNGRNEGGSSLPCPTVGVPKVGAAPFPFAHMLCHLCKRIALLWKYPYPLGFFVRILERAQLRMRIRRMHHIEWWSFSLTNFLECRTSGIYWTYRLDLSVVPYPDIHNLRAPVHDESLPLKLIDESAGRHFRRWEECCPVFFQVPVNLYTFST